MRLDRLRKTIEVQGYGGLSDRLVLELDPWLRVAPAFSAGWTAVATAMGSPGGLMLLAALSALGSLMPLHPFDVPYNFVLRHWIRGTPIPPAPAARRFAAVVAAAWLFVTALAFAAGRDALAMALGGLYTVVALVPVVSGLCVASWVWSRLRARRPAGPFKEISS